MSIYEQIAEVYKRDYKTFHKMAIRKVGDFWAEDLVQETFERALKYSPTYNPQLSMLDTWINRIFDSVVKKYRHANNLEELTEESWVTEEGPHNNFENVLEDFIKDLIGYKENQKQVLYCYFILGMRPREVLQVVPESLHNINWIVADFRRDMRGKYGIHA